jgi:hypothetical protein
MPVFARKIQIWNQTPLLSRLTVKQSMIVNAAADHNHITITLCRRNPLRRPHLTDNKPPSWLNSMSMHIARSNHKSQCPPSYSITISS